MGCNVYFSPVQETTGPKFTRGGFMEWVALRGTTMSVTDLRKSEISSLPPELRNRAVIVPSYTTVPIIKGTGDRHSLAAVERST